MTTLDETAIQLAATLAIESIPAKLRCGSCNKLAIDALKLPCCAQSICEPCSLTLPETCPICSHSPVSAEDCTPIKSLRMSVKAFLKNEQKKRNKDAEAPPPALTAAVESAPVAQPSADGAVDTAPAKQSKDAVNGQIEMDSGATARSIEAAPESQVPLDGENAGVRTSIETEAEQEDEEDDDDNVVITTERPEQEIEEQQHAGDESYDQVSESQHLQQNYGDGNANGDFGFGQTQPGFGGLDFNNMNSMNNFNPMMMQNGMGMPNFMGMQNMMGMPGMNMDPSMMFNGGFGMGGMNDMSMMGMGMPMGNMGGFNGMPGMGMNGGPGFFPGNGGYNQQNFGNSMHQNFHHNRGFGGRPYNRGFRGRGYGHNRGRGNWQNQGQFQQNPNYMNQQNQQSQQNFQGADDYPINGQQQVNRRGSPSYEPMNGAEQTTNDTFQGPIQTKSEEPGETNKADIDTTNHAGGDEAGIEISHSEDAGGMKQEGTKGMYDFVERSPAQAIAQVVAMEPNAEMSMKDVVNGVSNNDGEKDSAALSTSMEGGAQGGLVAGDGPQDAPAMNDGAQGQFYDQQYQQGYGYGARGRGGFRGGRGGFRGRGGAYGYVATSVEAVQPVAPPVNAPIGPKAFREGKPNHWLYSRPQQKSAPAVSLPIEATRDEASTREERDRSQSNSRPRSDREHTKEIETARENYDVSDETRHEKRRRRDDRYEDERNGDVNGDKSSHKVRSRSETPDDDKSRRRHREKDDRHSSRSHRDRSRDRHRRRHRSRSPGRDASDKEGDANESRRKSKNDRRYDDGYNDSRDKEKNRKSSRRDNDYDRDDKHRATTSSKHSRSGRDEREREREREREQEKHRPVLEEPQDDIGFKIKGSRSAAMQAGLDGTSMAPPTNLSRDRDSRRQSTTGTPNTPAGDPYAEERERRQRERLDRENSLRRQSTQSLGKRTSRDEDEFEAPMGPKSDAGRAGKKARRKVSYKYEDEVGDGYEDRDRRWR